MMGKLMAAFRSDPEAGGRLGHAAVLAVTLGAGAVSIGSRYLLSVHEALADELAGHREHAASCPFTAGPEGDDVLSADAVREQPAPAETAGPDGP